MRTIVLALALAAVAACERRGPPRREAALSSRGAAAAPRDEPCRPGRGTKLGQPFARVCPDATGDSREAPFWIHAVPVPCSAGEHGEIECPTVLPLMAPENGVPVARFAAMNSPLVDASTAHRLCALRFAGRLPTRRERVRARDALGLTTLSVVESTGAAGGHFDFRQVPEWVTEVPCDQPSLLGAECGATREPPESTTHGDGLTEWSCDAEFVGATSMPMIAAGEGCASGSWSAAAASGVLPCAASVTVASGARSTRFGFQLRCHPSAAQADPRRDTATIELAAVRCVVPHGLLDSRVR